MKRLMTIATVLFFSIGACSKSEESGDTKPATENKEGATKTTEDDKPKEVKPDKPVTPSKPAELEAVTLAKAPTADEKKAADELVAKLADKAQRSDALKAADGRTLTIVAATSTDPAVVGSALSRMAKAIDKKTAGADADFAAVTADRLGAADHKALAGALMAARHAIGGEAGEPIRKAAVELVADPSDPAAQYEGINLLGKWRDSSKNKDAIAALVKAVDSDAAYVSSQALVSLAFAGTDLVEDKDALKAKVTALLEHKNPAVRGEATAMLAKFVPFNDDGAAAKAIAALIMPLLADDNPFVKSRAATSLSSIKYKPAIHKIMPLLDDPTPNTFDNKDWKTPWGRTGWDHHDGSAWSRVDDAALYSLRSMTFFDSKNKFEYTINHKTKEADLKKAVEDAKKWYAANKASIPEA